MLSINAYMQRPLERIQKYKYILKVRVLLGMVLRKTITATCEFLLSSEFKVRIRFYSQNSDFELRTLLI